MPAFVRGMLILGLLALLAGIVMVWRSEEKQSDATSQSTLPISSGKPVGTSTLSHGGPASTAEQSDARDAVSQR